MQVTIVVILLSFCASLALPVPLDKSDQRRDGREISVEELESELEDIENRISSVRTKVKEESKENKENLETTKGTSPTSPTKTFAERKTDSEDQTTVANVKTTEEVHIIVEKKTSPTPTPEPTLTPKKQATNTKLSTTPSSTEKTPFVVKVEVEQEQKAGGAEEKLQEDKEKSEGGFVVQKVTEEVEEKEETDEEPKKIKVSKVANDETDWDEEADLESGRTGKSERPTKRISTGNAAVTTPVTTAESGFKVEKITPSPKSPTKSKQSEVTVEVERVPPKLNVETKRSWVERIEEDEDLKVGGAAKSPDGERKIEITVEKEPAETSSAKESSPAKGAQIIVEVEKASPPTHETPVKTTESGFKVEKITPSPKSPTKSKQSEVTVEVERVPPKLNVETKRSWVERIEEDEDLKVGGAAKSPDGERKIEITVEKESAETSSAKESSPAKGAQIIVEVEKASPPTHETPVKTTESGFKVEKITPSPKSPTKSKQSEVTVEVERVPPKLNVETKRSWVERIEEDEDLKVGGAAKSPDGERKIEITVEKESAETPSAKESSPAKGGQREIIVKVEKVSPATDETDEEIKEVKVVAKSTVKPTATREVPTSKGQVMEVSIGVEKITPSQRPTSGKSQMSMVKVVKLTSEEEDLASSEDKVNYKRSDDASEKTSDSEEEALELELEGGQGKKETETEKDKIDEQKLAQEFDKALEAERNGKENLKTVQPVEPTTSAEGPKTTKPSQVTTGKAKQTTEAKGDETDKQLEKQNDEAALEKEEAKKEMSDEELELAELAQKTMNDEDKEEAKPTEKPTTATSQEVVVKVEKVPKVTVQVTKERNEKLLSEKETAKEEKKLKDELENELEQEKAGPVPVIMKVKKLGDSPDPKPAAEKTKDASEFTPDKQEAQSNTDSEEEEQEAELEGETDAKSKRSASITRNDPEEQLENLLAM